MNASQEYDYHLKLLIIGNSGVGKSCMLMRYSENSFTNNFYNTIGVDFKIKSLSIGGSQVKLQIWDTAGQDRFKTITCSYYKGAHGIMVVFDVTDKESFEGVKSWIGEIEKFAQENVIKILVGNKSDLIDQRQVTYQEGLDLANQLKISYIETSAKSADNIDNSFLTISKEVISRLKVNKGSEYLQQLSQIPGQKKLNVGSQINTNQSGGCC